MSGVPSSVLVRCLNAISPVRTACRDSFAVDPLKYTYSSQHVKIWGKCTPTILPLIPSNGHSLEHLSLTPLDTLKPPPPPPPPQQGHDLWHDEHRAARAGHPHTGPAWKGGRGMFGGSRGGGYGGRAKYSTTSEGFVGDLDLGVLAFKV